MNAALAREQQALLTALWNADGLAALPSLAGLARPVRAGDAAQLQRGLLAYRAHGRALAARALAGAYPVLARQLGEGNFAPLARAYWLAHPPVAGDLAQWGGELAGFIALAPQLAGLPWLADLARVEWALHRLAFGPDVPADLASFSLLATRAAAALTLVVAPGTQCIASAWSVVRLVNEPVDELADEAPPAAAPETALLWRDGLRPRVRAAQAGEAALLAALQAGQPLPDALARAEGLDFNAWLTPAVQSGLVLGVTSRRTA